MTTKTMLGAAALLLGTLFATGCSGETANEAPIVDSVDAPLAIASHDGAYAVPMTILFHDNDQELVTHVRYRVGTSLDAILEIPGPNPTRQSAEVTIMLPASARQAAAEQGLQISLLDRRGAESHPFPAMVHFD